MHALVWREINIQSYCSVTPRGKNKEYDTELLTEPTRLSKQKNSCNGGCEYERKTTNGFYMKTAVQAQGTERKSFARFVVVVTVTPVALIVRFKPRRCAASL